MAQAELYSSSLRLVLDDGIDVETGKQVYKRKSFRNVKPDATADQLFAVANAMVELQERELYDIERKDSSYITEEA